MTHRILIVTAVAAEADSVAGGLASGGLASGGPGRGGFPLCGEFPLPGGFALRRHAGTSARPDTPVPRPGTPGHPGPYPVVDVLVAGVGPAAAATATATALAYAAVRETPGETPGEAPRETPATPPYDLVVSAGIAGGFAPHAPIGSVVVSDAVVGADLGAQTADGYLAVEELGFGRSVHAVDKALTGAVAAALAGGGQRHVLGPVLTVSTVTGTAGRAAELAERHPGAAAEAMEGFGVAEAAAAYGVPVVEIRAVSNAVGPRDRAAWRIGEALDSLRYAFQLLSQTVFVEPPS
ncbi:futalosine hydrolase [Streptomyces sp. NPDC085481]|uniref:futalosine hydrolase n=1 Tax=Streptomyces sp. NPDC085481 TaxID=3365727 RepID=UPI0037D3D189